MNILSDSFTATYFLANGHTDITKWAAVVLFEGQPGGQGADPLQAPVKPTSLRVGVDPLTVNAPVAPPEPHPRAREAQAAGTPTAASGGNPGDAASPQPAQGKQAEGFSFQAPLSVLPPGIEAVSPGSVTGPDSAAAPLPAIPDPTPVTPPGEASPPLTSANPQDGPLTVVAPGSVQSPNLPPVSTQPNPTTGVGFEPRQRCNT